MQKFSATPRSTARLSEGGGLLFVKTMVDEMLEDPEGRCLFNQEKLILELILNIKSAMKVENISNAQLAAKLGKKQSYITRFLNGNSKMTVREIADIMTAIGYTLKTTIQVDRSNV